MGLLKYGICAYPTNISPLRGNNECQRHGILVEMQSPSLLKVLWARLNDFSRAGTKYMEYVKAD